jgi:hypothetical protein
MLEFQIQETQANQFYSDKVNAQFHKSESHYVNLAERLREAVTESWQEITLDDALDRFKNRYPSLKSWNDFEFCEAQSATLDQIEIDVTMQRLFDLIHGCRIIDAFRQLMVMPIRVYVDPNRPGKYICWDGQHTALVLYIIASRILFADTSKCSVPIVISKSSLKSEMRESFVVINSPEGHKDLDHIDIVHQKIFGVRADGSKRPDWVLIEQKQQAYEGSKMFLTHPKFGDVDRSGAQARLDEFIDDRYSLTVNQNFCKYFFRVCQSTRPVQPKESWMMYEYFRLCEQIGIVVDDNHIKGIANSLRTAFNNDFDSNRLYNKAKASYQEWWKLNKPNPDGTLLGIAYSEKPIGMTFLLAQISKHFKGTMPKYKFPHWPVPDADLI